MSPTILLISKALSLSIIAGQIVLVAGLVYFFARRQKNDKLIAFVARNALPLAFLLAAGAMAGTLFYSEIAALPPCTLCWYQRIALYPQALILAIALWKKDKGIVDYVIGLSLVGALIAAYHSYLQYSGAQSITCSIIKEAVSCSEPQVLEFGYITIPVMSLTVFSLILFLMFISKRFSASS
ncbi:MAG: disulfide bond formation protein B [Candidatus Spechtbacteria bacterium]|nr:disulfide bond formation protein B [Candidatus Spechtbacteria bacterium]